MTPTPEGAAAFVAWMTGQPAPEPDPAAPTPAQLFAELVADALDEPTTSTAPAQDTGLADLMTQIAADAAHTQED